MLNFNVNGYMFLPLQSIELFKYLRMQNKIDLQILRINVRMACLIVRGDPRQYYKVMARFSKTHKVEQESMSKTNFRVILCRKSNPVG